MVKFASLLKYFIFIKENFKQMRKINFKLSLLLILTFNFSTIYSQIPLRQVYFTTTTSFKFAVPLETDMNQITDLDLVKMIIKEKTERVEMVIDLNQELSITNFYDQMPRYDYDYEYGIGKVITNQYGTTLFDHEGIEVNYSPNENPDLDFIIDLDAISHYGLMPAFETDLTFYAEAFTNLGFATSISDEREFFAITDTSEFYINPTKQIMEIRYFKGGLLELSDWKKYQTIDGKTIPLIFIRTTYENLTNNIRLQKSEIIKYQHYSVLNEKGDMVVEYTSQSANNEKNEGISIAQYKDILKKSPSLVVFPNPAIDEIAVSIPSSFAEIITVEIINLLGKVVYSDQQVMSGSSIRINVSNLQSGVYILRCGKGNSWNTNRFIKQ